MRVWWIIAAVLGFIGAAFAQTEHPNFTGVWVLNTAKSKLQIPDAPVASTFIFIHNDPKWHMERTHFYRDRKPNTIHFDRVIGGEPVVTRDGDDVTTSRMLWDGNTVVLDEQMTEGNEHGSNHVIYSLSAEGNLLTALEREDFPDGKFTNRWVFDRLPIPAMNDRYPDTGLTETAFATLKKTIARDYGDCDPKGPRVDVQVDYALLSLGTLGPGVITRSSKSCDCGATRNCLIHVYQRHAGAFHDVPFRDDASPSGSAYGVTVGGTGWENGRPTRSAVFLVTGSHMSADTQALTWYQYFDGMFTALGSECTRLKYPEPASHPNHGLDLARFVIQSCSAP